MTVSWTDAELQDLKKPSMQAAPLAADLALLGPKIPPQQQIVLYSDAQWEEFVHEWAHFCLKKKYKQVQRFSGSGDRGVDVAGFTDDHKLNGVWDNYQCKHYDHALYPTDALPEIGKMLWHAFNKQFAPPRRYYFVAPRGVGTTLNGLLSNAPELKKELVKRWEKDCKSKITAKQDITLEGVFLAYVENFDFTIFNSKTALALVEDHQHCPMHAAQFGGGLPVRPDPPEPPEQVDLVESRYIKKLLDAYADHKKEDVPSPDHLKKWSKLKDHFFRQRIAFYHAKSLRVFARDTVPDGTFKSLQQDIYIGVIDTHDAEQPDGYARVCAVTKSARDLQITTNALITRSKPQDRDGICHQLANEDRLKWTSE